MNLKNYIGVGVGGLIGGYTQDANNNPFSAAVGATVGAILGQYVHKDIIAYKNKFKDIITHESFLKLNTKNEKFKTKQKLTDLLFDHKHLHKLYKEGPDNFKGYFETLFKHLHISEQVKRGELDTGTIDRYIQLGQEAAKNASLHDLEKVNKATTGYRLNLSSTKIKPVYIKQAEDVGASYVEQFDALFNAMVHNNLSKDEAKKTASGLAAALQGRKLKINYGMNAIPESLSIEGVSQKMLISQYVNMKNGPRVRATGLMHLTEEDLLSKRTVGIISGINLYAGMLDNEIVEHGFNDKTGEFIKTDRPLTRLITLDDFTQGSSIEELFGQEARRKGSALVTKEIEELLGIGRSAVDYNAYHTRSTINQAATAIKLERSISSKGYIRRTNTREMNDIVERFAQERNTNVLRSLSMNRHFTIGSSDAPDISTLDILQQKQFGGSVIREAIPMEQADVMKIFDGKYSYMREHGQSTGIMHISEDLNEIFSRHFGAQYHIGDGTAIFLGKVNNQSIYNNKIARNATVGILNRDRGKFSWHNFGDLFSDEFFSLSAEEKIARMHARYKGTSKDPFHFTDTFGLDKDSLELGVKGYGDYGIIKDVIKTDRGIEILHDVVSKQSDGYIKIFSQLYKAAGPVVQKEDMADAMRALAGLEASGRITVRDGKLINPETGKEVDIHQAINTYGKMHDIRKETKDIGIITTFARGKQEAIEEILSGRDGEEVDKVIKNLQPNPFIKDDPFAQKLLGTIKDKTQTRVDRANSMRMLQMFPSEARDRSAKFENLAIQANRVGRNIKVQELMDQAQDMLSKDKGRRLASQQYIWKLMEDTYGKGNDSPLRQSITHTVFGLRTGIEILGAGNRASASRLQMVTMKFAGFSDNMINSMFDANPEATRDLDYIASSANKGTIGDNLTQDQQKKLAHVFSITPEERKSYLRNIGIEVGEDASSINYQMVTDHLGYKSIPIAFESTNRTNVGNFGTDLYDVPSELERKRKAVTESDIAFRLASNEDKPSIKLSTIDAIEELHGSIKGSLGEITKESAKRRAKVGINLRSASIGGIANDAADLVIAKGHGKPVFVGEGTIREIQRQHKEAYGEELELEYENIEGLAHQISQKDKDLIASLIQKRTDKEVDSKIYRANLQNRIQILERGKNKSLDKMDRLANLKNADQDYLKLLQSRGSTALAQMQNISERLRSTQESINTISMQVSRYIHAIKTTEHSILHDKHLTEAIQFAFQTQGAIERSQKNSVIQLVKFKSSGKYLIDLFNREPSQSAFSVISGILAVHHDLSDKDANTAYHPEKYKVNDLSQIGQKRDSDDDTLSHTFATNLADKESGELNEIMQSMHREGERLIPLMSALDPKRKPDPGHGLTSILDIDNIKEYEARATQTGGVRGTHAPAITMINEEMTKALMEDVSLNMKDKLRAKSVVYQMTESLLKSARTGVMDNDLGHNVDMMAQFAESARTYKINEAQFKTQFSNSMDLLFHAKDLSTDISENNGPSIFQQYTSGRDTAISRYYNMLAKRSDDSRDAVTQVRRSSQDTIQQIAASIHRFLPNEIHGHGNKGSNVYVETNTRTKTIREVAPNIIPMAKELWSRNKTPLLIGAGILGGLAVANAAQATEIPARDMPMPSQPQILEPRQDIKAYSRKLRDNKGSYDVTAKVRTDKFNRNKMRKFLSGDDASIRADINIKQR